MNSTSVTGASNHAHLAHFEINDQRGFLPEHDPLEALPRPEFAAWEKAAQTLPKLLASDSLRAILEALPEFNTTLLANKRELERAMIILSYLGHSYVFFGGNTAQTLPARLAKPWYEVATKLGRPPVLSYGSYALHNWRRFDDKRTPELGNIALLQNFFGGIDEEWFILIHIDIEFKATRALNALLPAQVAAKADDVNTLTSHLSTIADVLRQMNATMNRMPEWCDPYIYYARVRPYIHGWKNNPALPNGLVYEGVSEYGGKGQFFRGETGAQSSIVPALDGAFGVTHKHDVMRDYLMEMRTYMPPKHRAFIEEVEQTLIIRDCVMKHGAAHPTLKDAYNACVEEVEKFRTKHLEYAAKYIQKQSQQNSANPTEVGTGGTPFMPYLKKHRDETAEHTLA
jgi:indoleamine 2,3-dioxygenase